MSKKSADIQIDVDVYPHEQLVPLVEATVFGSGDLKYRRIDVSSQLKRFNKPAFFHALDSSGELVGVYVLDERDLSVAGKAVKGYYRGVLAVDERCQGQGLGRQLTLAAKSWMTDKVKTAKRDVDAAGIDNTCTAMPGGFRTCAEKDSTGRDSTGRDSTETDSTETDSTETDSTETDSVDTVLSDESKTGVALPGVALSYGCIDQSNIRSISLLQSTGAYVASTLSMYMMYRQFPSISCTLEPLTRTHAIEVNELRAELYADCLVKDLTQGRIAELALCDNQGIAISARVQPSAFNIAQMGSLAAFATRWLVSPFSAARKRFDPEAFTYVTFSDILIRQGCERFWPRFVSTILAQHDCYWGMTYVDPGSQLFVRLQKASGLSRFAHSRQGSIKVVLQSSGLDEVMDARLRRNSMAVKLSPIDV